MFKRFLTILGLMALFISPMGFQPSPASAEEGDFHYTVVSKDFAYSEAEFTIKDRERLLINGATQLTWWAPDHNVKLTGKTIRKAPKLKVRYTKCAKQSRAIAKQSKGASIVIAKVGSTICNTGMNGNIVGGFKWHVSKGPAILKWNKKLKLYEHVFNLIRPGNVQADDEVVGFVRVGGVKYAIVKTCKNRMGGHVDVMYPQVTQVRYVEDVMESGLAEANAEVSGGVTFEVTCPNGANFRTTVTTKANAHSEAKITFSERTRVSALAAKKFELEQKLKVDGDAEALAEAESKIEVSGNCGSNPEPPTHDECPNIPGDQPEGYDCKGPDAQDITLVNRVLVGNKISLDLTGTLAMGRTAEIFCKALNGGTISSGNRQTVTTTPWSVKIDYVAPGEIPDVLKDSSGNVIVPKGHDMVECIVTQDNGLTDVIRTEVGPGKFEIFEMPADPQ